LGSEQHQMASADLMAQQTDHPVAKEIAKRFRKIATG